MRTWCIFCFLVHHQNAENDAEKKQRKMQKKGRKWTMQVLRTMEWLLYKQLQEILMTEKALGAKGLYRLKELLNKFIKEKCTGDY